MLCKKQRSACVKFLRKMTSVFMELRFLFSQRPAFNFLQIPSATIF